MANTQKREFLLKMAANPAMKPELDVNDPDVRALVKLAGENPDLAVDADLIARSISFERFLLKNDKQEDTLGSAILNGIGSAWDAVSGNQAREKQAINIIRNRLDRKDGVNVTAAAWCGESEERLEMLSIDTEGLLEGQPLSPVGAFSFGSGGPSGWGRRKPTGDTPATPQV